MNNRGQSVVVDTNIVFEGLTQSGTASSLILDAWLAGLFRPVVSNALAYEYLAVLSTKLSRKRWNQIRPVLGLLLENASFTHIHFSWRPSSPDPDDEHVIDCAMNSSALIVASNQKDFQEASLWLGIQVLSAEDFAALLASE